MTTTQEPGDVIDLRDAGGDTQVITAVRADSGTDVPRTDSEPKASARAAVAPAPVGSTSDVVTIVSRGLATFSILVAAMLAFLFVFSGFAEARTQVGLRRTFAHDIAYFKAPIGGAISSGIPVAEIRIPAIGLHQIVVQGTTSGLLREGPGHLRQTPLPGQQGNSVIFGRREAYGGPFRHLSSLSPGEHISVWTGEGHRTYIVDHVGTASASDGSELVDIPGKNQLTLVSSDPVFFASQRLVVTSHLVGTPYAPSADTTPVTRAELGLAGETDGVLALVLWLELLLVVAVGATWLWRRWTRWSAYVVCVPIVLAVTWIVFENVTKLLPATL